MANLFKLLLFLGGIIFIELVFSEHITFISLGSFSVFITLSLIVFGVIIFLENRNPTNTVAWFFVFSVFPFFGFVFYLLFGRNYRKERKFRRKYIEDQTTFEKLENAHAAAEKFGEIFSPEKRKILKLAEKIGNSKVSFASHTEVLTNGEQTFDQIMRSLSQAKKYIHLEYYILRNDQLGNELMELLVKKAAEGVEVRFLLDAVGSWVLPSAFFKKYRQKGVDIVLFNPVKIPFINSRVNFRNHRKIIIVDGKEGFIGGLNIGDEYLGKDKYFGFWRDTHLKVFGEAVRTMEIIFIQDWLYMRRNENISWLNYDALKTNFSNGDIKNNPENGGVQIISGGPDNRFSVLKDLFFAMINSAEKSIWIASPYFIPDEDIFSALKIAAMSGIEVCLLLPDRPDKLIVFHASRSYLPQLLEVGVKVYEYKRGFMHSKVIIVDEELASIGTANMDMRSFHLNFEVNAFLYNTKSIKKLKEDFLDDIKESTQIHRETFMKRSIFRKLFESLARLVSPFL